jgi:hypothetical protein
MKTNQDIAPRLWKLAESATTFSAKDTLKEAACEIETMREEIARLLDENNAYKSDIEAGRLLKLPCSVGDTVYYLWYTKCRHGETYPDSYGCCGCEDECDMRPTVVPIVFQNVEQILSNWKNFHNGWYYMTEQSALAALEGRQSGRLK